MLVLPKTLRFLLVWVSFSPTCSGTRRETHFLNVRAAGWHSDEAPMVLPPTRGSRSPARRPRYIGTSPRASSLWDYMRHWKRQHNEEGRDRLRIELYTGCHDYLGRIANDWDDGDGRAWPPCREQAPGPRSHRDFYPIRVRHTDKMRVKPTEGRPAALREGGGWSTRGKRAKSKDGRAIKRSAAVLSNSDRVEKDDGTYDA
ncbi:hypothetical protein EV121DRAFT_259523, partial [Schizophyllum commune]